MYKTTNDLQRKDNVQEFSKATNVLENINKIFDPVIESERIFFW